ncbi:Bug family tripartite tricarboxylate transporter substrate binding protein [Pararoseomonas indoligenes]|uniref:Tripartite tricarboxylate transporter substrate binding protein n=1 Tax=Roseomonas indoligenes TaxID=2820811 RepID=A0A940MX70_9PROT|nr:tripartite tricarboxylate transporter substrate binding protein [Pararoseomonas indoligenes]
MILTRRMALAGAAGLAGSLVPRAGAAEEMAGFPSRTAFIVVPFPPGGGTDVFGRLLAMHFGAAWRQNVVVENRSGAGGRIGTQAVQRAPADGHTLLIGTTGTLLAMAGPGGDPPFVSRDELTPITLITAPGYVVTVAPSLGVRTVAELISEGRRRPGGLAFGSSGAGAVSHLAGELFAAMAGIQTLHVPYRGTGPAVADLQGGRIQVMFAPPQTVAGPVAAGQLRNIAITSERRSALTPDLPTVAESGLPGYAAVGWFGLFGPRGMPGAVASRIHRDAARALERPENRERLAALGAEPEPMEPDAFASHVDGDVARWQRLVRERRIQLE